MGCSLMCQTAFSTGGLYDLLPSCTAFLGLVFLGFTGFFSCFFSGGGRGVSSLKNLFKKLKIKVLYFLSGDFYTRIFNAI